jgi:hypothetical protein
MAEPEAKPSAVPEHDFHIGEEMDKAKWTLPPIHIVLIALLLVMIVVGVLAWINRYKPPAAASIDQVFAVEQNDKSGVLVAVQITLRNTASKSWFIHTLKGELKADGKTLTDDAPVAAVDFDRYFQAYPALREHATEPLKAETRITPGAEVRGTVLFGFPVSKDAFDKRESLSVTVEPYDSRPMVLSEKPQPK